jgi:hypothetical protein
MLHGILQDDGPAPSANGLNPSKGAGAPGNADAGRGASSVKDGGRLIYTATPMADNDAALYSIDREERWQYIRVDKGKVNLLPQTRNPKWLRLVPVRLDNTEVNPVYPRGDEIQTVEPWEPPPIMGHLTRQAIHKILDKIDEGYTPGRRYSGESQATKRGAWHVVQEFCTDLNEKQAKIVIRTWLKEGILVSDYYDDPEEGKMLKGVTVGRRP